jgi:hypothetical protein
MLEKNKVLFIERYTTFGDKAFYKFLLSYAIEHLANELALKKEIAETTVDDLTVKSELTKPETITKKIYPHIELLNYSNQFIQYYRREKNALYLEIAACFRRAANKIYRLMLKKNLIQVNNKFLNIIAS